MGILVFPVTSLYWGAQFLLPQRERKAENGKMEFSQSERDTGGRRPNGFLGLSLNDRTILFQVISLDKTVSVG